MTIQEAMDKIQSEVIKCCGVRGPQDYVFNAGNSTQDNSTTITEYKVPKSCCKVEAGCKFDQVITNINGANFYTHVRRHCFLFFGNIWGATLLLAL